MKHLWWVLFGALLLQMIFNPCWQSELGQQTFFYVALNSLVVCAIVVRLWQIRFVRLLALLLALPILAILWLPWIPYDERLLVGLSGLLYLLAIAVGFPLLMRVRQIGLSELAGGCSLYLLIGLAWAHLYLLIELGAPGSFSGGGLGLAEFTYYSFTTLTTLGYGDIAPVSCEARSLATLEAVSGLFCLSFVIGRMISLHAASLLGSGEETGPS